MFNGPGFIILEHYIYKNGLKHYKETYYDLSKGKLKELNEFIPEKEKIKLLKL